MYLNYAINRKNEYIHVAARIF